MGTLANYQPSRIKVHEIDGDKSSFHISIRGLSLTGIMKILDEHPETLAGFMDENIIARFAVLQDEDNPIFMVKTVFSLIRGVPGAVESIIATAADEPDMSDKVALFSPDFQFRLIEAVAIQTFKSGDELKKFVGMAMEAFGKANAALETAFEPSHPQITQSAPRSPKSSRKSGKG